MVFIISGNVTPGINARIIYYSPGFKKGLLPIKYQAHKKLTIQITYVVNDSSMKRRKCSLIMPAAIAANVRINGKKSILLLMRDIYTCYKMLPWF